MSALQGRWQVEQVLALAPKPASVSAAQPLAVPGRWSGAGCDHRAVWGRCVGGSAEPYECVADHVAVAFRCTCPSRVRPCKHVLALLLLWARGQVAEAVGEPPRFVTSWLAPLAGAAPPPGPPEPPLASPEPPSSAADVGAGDTSAPEPSPPPPPTDPNPSRDDRVARMAAGLAELDRWLDDRLRTGLTDPSLASYRTWDDLAARLVDAQVGGLSNRVRRLAGAVGNGPDWHEHVLTELGILHLLAVAGRQLGSLPAPLADSVAATMGWQVRQADVLAGVPHTDHWVVMGRSDVREDRIEVRRLWLRGANSGRWAMVMSFAAYQQRLDDSLVVGTSLHADLFRYPGALGLRSIVGRRHGEPEPAVDVRPSSVAQACTQVGDAIIAEPWIERFPLCVLAAPTRVNGRWVLTDRDGSLPVVEGVSGLAALLACSQGAPLPITAEWTPKGLVPLTAHLPDRAVDVGPVADPSFVGAA
ncbi:MAG: SWIM zinc finger family protein [Actinobacteria bacterium]|nr:SWIM zinc finger family protein [Actinomycetota bacterium]